MANESVVNHCPCFLKIIRFYFIATVRSMKDPRNLLKAIDLAIVHPDHELLFLHGLKVFK